MIVYLSVSWWRCFIKVAIQPSSLLAALYIQSWTWWVCKFVSNICDIYYYILFRVHSFFIALPLISINIRVLVMGPRPPLGVDRRASMRGSRPRQRRGAARGGGRSVTTAGQTCRDGSDLQRDCWDLDSSGRPDAESSDWWSLAWSSVTCSQLAGWRRAPSCRTRAHRPAWGRQPTCASAGAAVTPPTWRTACRNSHCPPSSYTHRAACRDGPAACRVRAGTARIVLRRRRPRRTWRRAKLAGGCRPARRRHRVLPCYWAVRAWVYRGYTACSRRRTWPWLGERSALSPDSSYSTGPGRWAQAWSRPRRSWPGRIRRKAPRPPTPSGPRAESYVNPSRCERVRSMPARPLGGLHVSYVRETGMIRARGAERRRAGWASPVWAQCRRCRARSMTSWRDRNPRSTTTRSTPGGWLPEARFRSWGWCGCCSGYHRRRMMRRKMKMTCWQDAEWHWWRTYSRARPRPRTWGLNFPGPGTSLQGTSWRWAPGAGSPWVVLS